ncbi:MAG: T9SS type A sorting domain-containing protein [Gemmatimonadetes bacterium]|nr:T9SS type A sorting domain-containing protein [Gemmatimonadota bacterium]
MHVLGRKKGALLIALLAIAFGSAAPLAAKPAPGAPAPGFRLFTRAAFRWVGNRTQCFLASSGQICTAESSTIGGGYWPAGTNNQYIFNTGLQIAGKVDPASAGNSWAGSIDGAFFFNARGGGNGQQITEIYNSGDPADAANWPAAAYVPCDPTQTTADLSGSDPKAVTACSNPLDKASSLYSIDLQGRPTASDNDIWFLSWEGDPSLSGGRTHPLGILVETRGLAYNTPGKNDLMFFIFTFYNVTAASSSGAYAQAPTRIRSYLEDAGDNFLALNRAKGATLPDGGYTLQDMYLAFGADMDVTVEASGNNYAGVNVPMAMGYTYHYQFTAPGSWSFDPTIYKNPFFAGSGFIGVKYLKSPEVNGQEVGLTLFGSTSNGGQFSDPRNTQALYRYLSGTVDPAQGDDICNVGNVQVTKICYINQGTSADMRFFQSSGPLTVAAGDYSSIAVAYVFAAPVKSGACQAPNCATVRPQDPTGSLLRMADPATAQAGVNTIDTITGWAGYKGDLGKLGGAADGLFNTYDIDAVPGSLLGNAQVAQEIFDLRFVQPTPPKAPNFFAIPGDKKVTIVWQPSETETTGDNYSSASDPNYRRFDVAGYRVYRGRRAEASGLTLLAQFDIQNDVFIDVTGQVNTVDAQGFTDCAPDLGVYVSCTAAGTNPAGVPLTAPRTISLDAPITQHKRVVPSGAVAYAAEVDTAVTGGASGYPALSGTGVPYIFTDEAGACNGCGVQNGQNYYYMVTAFDVNSVRSGNTSLESQRTGPKRVVPQRAPANTSSSGALGNVVVAGRNGPLPAGTVPTIDATNGTFSGPFPPADGATISLAAFLPQVLPASGAVKLLLEDIEPGSAYNAIPATYHWGAISGTDTFRFTTSLDQDATSVEHSTSGLYDAVQLDPTLAAKYGGGAGYKLLGSVTHSIPGNYYTSEWGRGCVNGAADFVAGACDYNGARWFDGANETYPHPTRGNNQNFAPGTIANRGVVGGVTNGGWNNAGSLAGVEVIHQVMGYQTVGNNWRDVAGVLGASKRAADMSVYWGAGGKIDSVIDVTHDVVIPFGSRVGPTWGILNTAATQTFGTNINFDRRTELSITDFGCVEPLRSLPGPQTRITCGTATLGDGPLYALDSVAQIGAIVHYAGTQTDVRTSTNTGTGFALAMPGGLYMFQAAALPATGAVWTLRDYVGAIGGGGGAVGAAGDDGPYSFVAYPRPFQAVGASLQIAFTTANAQVAATKKLLDNVHPVPDPYYVTTTLEPSNDTKIIKFINLPTQAIIRIYSASGVLVRVLEHNSAVSNELTWDVRNRNGQFVASGVYFYHIESGDARRVGRMTIVNFAQ